MLVEGKQEEKMGRVKQPRLFNRFNPTGQIEQFKDLVDVEWNAMWLRQAQAT